MLQRALESDVDAARRHLRLLAGEEDPVAAFQVFDDSKSKPDAALASSFHGRLAEVRDRLVEAQAAGCGVFVAVNEIGKGKRRLKENVEAARALFLDLDGAPLPSRWLVEPHLVIESSPGRFQCWWMIEPMGDLAKWEAVQKELAGQYGGDLKCALWTQVGRLAGFYHQKRTGDEPARPWRVRVVAARPDAPRFQFEALVEAMAIEPTVIERPDRQRRELDVGADDPADIERATALLVVENNWQVTSDGAVSIYKMACRLRDLGLSAGLAEELISEHLPIPWPDHWRDDHIERKVANAYRYAKGEAGIMSSEASRAAFDEMPCDEPPVVREDEPDEAAALYLRMQSPNLRQHQGEWMDWDGAGYAVLEDKTVSQRLGSFLRTATVFNKKGKRRGVDGRLVSSVREMVENRVHIPAGQFDPPCWLERREDDSPATEMLALQNGLLHIPTGKFMEPTPRFFTRTPLAFSYDPDAPEPTEWLRFLDLVYDGRADMIALLQEAVGLMLTPDTSRQVIILRVGPSGGGKGTEIRVIQKLLNQANCTNQTLRQMGNQFGLQSVIGKLLLTVTDAYVTKQVNTAEVAQTLLRISGEDPMTIQRKFLPDWQGRLQARIWIAGTEEPILPDRSGSLLRRYVPILSYADFTDAPDRDLEDKLERELPSILLWALTGWRRLRQRGGFVLPEDSQAMLKKIRLLTNPVAVFVEDCCVIAADARVRKDDLLTAFRSWAGHLNEGLAWTTEEQFGVWLKSATKRRVETIRPRTGPDGKQELWYAGIRLSDQSPEDGVDPF